MEDTVKEECWACDKVFEYKEDDVYDSSEIVEGQYTVYQAVVCPHCGCSTRW